MLERTIQHFIETLAGIPEDSFNRERVLAELGHSVIEPGSLKPYLYFCSTHYTRNLIHRCGLFEVIAIGWEKGQVSPVHNHRGQECWMGVPTGKLEVRNFRLVEKDDQAKSCRLEPSDRFIMDPEHPAAVDPDEPIHSVHNLEEYGCRAVSVHVYSRPFDSCEVYLPEEGRYFDVPLEYTSRNGILCPGIQTAVHAG